MANQRAKVSAQPKTPPAKSLRLVLGDQLFPWESAGLRPGQQVWMSEDWELCTHFRYHKHKILFFLGAMRAYRDSLREKQVVVQYAELSENLRGSSLQVSQSSQPFEERLIKFALENEFQAIEVFEIEDHFLARRLQKAATDAKVELKVLPSPAFLTSRQEFESYARRNKKPFMKTFYENQRKKGRWLLASDGSPLGGKWSLDEDNRRPLPKEITPPLLPLPSHPPFFSRLCQLVDKVFAHHNGESSEFWLPLTREDALAWLHDFLEKRLEYFGPYEDALGPHPFVFHSVLSPLLNAGLLLPQEVLRLAIAKFEKHNLPLNSMEGFLRQVLGWREFVRGIYHEYDDRQQRENFFQHHGKLSDAWKNAQTGVEPLDEVIAKLNKRGWVHHIERLMILGNVMLLVGVHPQEAYRYFMENFVDSADWVMGPNVFGMSQFSDGGIFATKPYVCGSNYWLKMGPWKRGSWCDAIDGLYWDFIDRNRDFYAKNPRMGMVLSTLAKIEPQRRQKIAQEAQVLRERLVCSKS
jgi:deoxyribodipyrimidine photolyase-related protein